MRLLILGLLSISTLVTVATATGQSDPPPGKAPFERVCAACHGDDAKGNQGPSLVPLTLEYDEFLAQVRNGGGEMKQISRAEMTDDEVKQVFEYLKSLDPR